MGCQLDLGQVQGIQGFFQQDPARVGGEAVGWDHGAPGSGVVGVLHVGNASGQGFEDSAFRAITTLSSASSTVFPVAVRCPIFRPLRASIFP